ncbi:GNAT family N-acetyltransferase [Halomonas caseinilytica]|uniref:GNAT family N-acetyltransferase n=1 Tax=Halomonas caseinilytica TaxID=438744 RepID=UPI0007E57A30|nr:GNAT family N-acetyltransferase [Halomonas caseinilytica]SEN02678.1 Protein N-acetyltransferase, RimJ/RimL family [Halomonas caseinilytica]
MKRSRDLSFETDRLTIRRLSKQDLPDLAAILSDPAVMRFSVRGVCDRRATRRFLDWSRDCHAIRGFGPMALIERESGEFVGFCGLVPEEVAGVEEIGIGYRLARRFWHRGLAPEAARAVLANAFDAQCLETVVAVIEPAHLASIRVAEKVGFRAFVTSRFHGRDVRLYRLSREQWREMATPVG